jgi:hypothetical protein
MFYIFHFLVNCIENNLATPQTSYLDHHHKKPSSKIFQVSSAPPQPRLFTKGTTPAEKTLRPIFISIIALSIAKVANRQKTLQLKFFRKSYQTKFLLEKSQPLDTASLDQGCQIYLGTTYQNGENTPK